MRLAFELMFYFLILALVLVKGGTVISYSMSWVAISMLCLSVCFFQVNNKFIVDRFETLVSFESKSPLFIYSLFILWVFVQVLFGISLDTQATINKLMLSIGFFAFLVLLSTMDWKPVNIKRLVLFVVVLGTVKSLYGLFVYLTQTNKILWMEKLFYLDKPTGTFVNANHFCAYLSIVLVLITSYCVCRLSPKLKSQRGRKGGFAYGIAEQLLSPIGIIWLLLLVTIFMTRSIGGIGSLLLAFLFLLGVLFINRVPKKYLFALIFVVVGLVTGILLLAQTEVVSNEWQGLGYSFERRLNLSLTSFYMALDNWFLGVGGGAFYSTFSQYRNLSVGNSYYNFAHNDFMQFWIEYGLIGVSLLSFMILQCLRVNLLVLKNSVNLYRHVFAYTSIYATVMLAFHSLVDFPLQVPAYALLYLIVIFFNPLTWNTKKSFINEKKETQ